MKYRYRNKEEMTESGVEWIGMVPKGWKIKQLNTLTEKIAVGLATSVTKYYRDEGVPIIRNLNIKENRFDSSDILFLDKDFAQKEKNKMIKKDDIILVHTGSNIGLACMVPKEFDNTHSFTTLIVRVKKNEIYHKFLMYHFNSHLGKTQVNLLKEGIGKDNLNVRNFKSYKCTLPSYSTQKKIVNFVDEKIVRFDSIISKKEALIQKLEEVKKSLISEVVIGKVKVVKTFHGYELVERKKEEMKDSGVEWLRDVPKEWEVKKLKYTANITGGYAFSSESFKDEGVQLIKIANLYNNRLSLERQPNFLDKEFLETHKDFVVTKGDILISLTGTLGKRDYGYSIFLNDNRKFLLNQRVGKIKFNSSMLTNYGIYVLQSEVYLSQLYALPTGTKQANLSNEQVLSIYIPLPNNEEQKLLYVYLDFKMSEIENLIIKTQHQIKKLKQSKQSLISEAVTGKIEILE